jgi:hypothetical protein
MPSSSSPSVGRRRGQRGITFRLVADLGSVSVSTHVFYNAQCIANTTEGWTDQIMTPRPAACARRVGIRPRSLHAAVLGVQRAGSAPGVDREAQYHLLREPRCVGESGLNDPSTGKGAGKGEGKGWRRLGRSSLQSISQSLHELVLTKSNPVLYLSQI